MVIDPAGDAARILNNISELNLKIGLIVVTHTHPDHCESNEKNYKGNGLKEPEKKAKRSKNYG
jgi:glyoxylase-like metal-dependent hydrolase (beta-lactamase superfamily II)